jgi:hypothetical protein
LLFLQFQFLVPSSLFGGGRQRHKTHRRQPALRWRAGESLIRRGYDQSIFSE